MVATNVTKAGNITYYQCGGVHDWVSDPGNYTVGDVYTCGFYQAIWDGKSKSVNYTAHRLTSGGVKLNIKKVLILALWAGTVVAIWSSM